MKKLLTLIMALACIISVNAQETTTSKEVLIVDNFTMPSRANSVYCSVVEGIRNKIIVAIIESKRVEVIDASSEAFFAEMQSEVSSEAALMSVIEGAELREIAQKKFGAKYGLTGHIGHMQGVRNRLDNGTIYYNGEMSITLKVINLEDGTVVHSKDYVYSGITGANGSSETAAVTNTSEYLMAAMPQFIDKAFKVNGKIIAIQVEKRGKAKEVIIDLGSAAGVKEKDKFKVFQVKIVAGHEMRTEVGKLQILEVGGSDISIAKVSGRDCDELIYQYINEPGSVELVLESTSKSGFGAGLSAFGKTLLK